MMTAKRISCGLIIVFSLFVDRAGLVARAASDPAGEAMSYIRPEAIRADMRFLADDLLEGRGAGTRGHEIAARFVAARFEADGLEPAGDNGTYFQFVPFRSFHPDEKHTSLTLLTDGKEETLAFRQDFITYRQTTRTETSVEAPVVYVGYGITAPDQSYDDYQNIDAKGKIVAFLYGAPPKFESTMRAHYSFRTLKAANAVAHGAVGFLYLHTPEQEHIYSFVDQMHEMAFSDFHWVNPEGIPGDNFEQLRGYSILSLDGVSKLLAGSGKTPEELFHAARESKPLSFTLPVAARIHVVDQAEDLRSPNVVARLLGSDPNLRDEYVVFTAHSDHLGIGDSVNGDNIYNGAIDDASGTACLLEIAKAFSRMSPRPRRSILFVSTTAEEKGMLGSDYFAHYPTVPISSIVADVDIDGEPLLWPMEDVILYGAGHSSLDVSANEAAKRMGLDVTPDPWPEQGEFVRQDGYSFVRQGIPTLEPDVGIKSSDPKINPRAMSEWWNDHVYHTPKEDMNQKLDFEAGAKYARYNFLLGYLVVQKTERPAWNPGDFFGETYGKRK
jgi:Zn-dependent M28 family amino/carboxypeptidase